MHDIHTRSIKKTTQKPGPKKLNIHILFCKQVGYERGYKDGKKFYLRLMDSKMVLSILDLCFNCEARFNICIV